MFCEKLGTIEIRKVTELPGLAMPATSLLPSVTPDILAEGRAWLGPAFIHPDEETVYLSFHSYLVKTGRHNILVDTCCGNCKNRLSMPGWHQLNTPYLGELARAGVRPEEIDIVVCTHLHADHVGWNTQLVDGVWVPTFPNARYLFGRQDFEHWQALYESNPPNPVNRGAHEDSVLPIVERGMADLVENDHVVMGRLGDGIWLEPSPGHSPGHVSVNIAGGGRYALLCGDAIHHPLQLTHPYLRIAADFDSAQAEATRRAMLERLADSDSLLLTAHFPTPTSGRVIRQGDAFGFRFGA
jgi:glyoxylase-like metal-dependent hydrolase (beta-lactamase superfamily II)